MGEDIKCTHYWKCGSRRYDGPNACITPEHCLKCGAARDLIETWEKKGQIPIRSYTAIRYPKGKSEIKEDTTLGEEQLEKKDQETENQGGQDAGTIEKGLLKGKPESQGKGGNTQKMREYHDAHKKEIISDYKYMGFSATARKWEIPSGSMSGLLRRWGIETSKSAKKHGKKTVSPLELVEERTVPVGTDGSKIRSAADNSSNSRTILREAGDTILADFNKGILIKDICVKWGISRKSFENFRRKHGMSVGPRKQNLNIVDIVDGIFKEASDIYDAKQRWIGAKTVIEAMKVE